MHSMFIYLVMFVFLFWLPLAAAKKNGDFKKKPQPPQPQAPPPRIKSARFHTPAPTCPPGAAEAAQLWPERPVRPTTARLIHHVLPNGMWSLLLVDCPRVALRYVDAKGEVTERNIIPKSARGTLTADRPETYAIVAYCLLRREERMFLKDGMIWLTDCATGELLDLDVLIGQHLERD